MELNKIYQGDCAEVLKGFPDESIDLILTSPPFDKIKNYNGYIFDMDHFELIAQELTRILKPRAVLVWIVGEAIIDGCKSLTPCRQQIYFKDKCKLLIHDRMIAVDPNSLPSRGDRYTQIAKMEMVIISKEGKPKTFNPVMIPCITAGKPWNKPKNLREDKPIKKGDYITKDYKKIPNIVKYRNNNKTPHPATNSMDIAELHVKTWSNEGDIVLDPMCGSGTHCIAAKQLNRNYIGIDISQEYVDITEQRLITPDLIIPHIPRQEKTLAGQLNFFKYV